ncbi:hypothetical protein HQN64_22875 [Enterobacteriaceae bacterium BIT-l23]|jgi:hypothetical protein|uniref:hypothetical protein n=1 Tax=Jejubacter sp. L23 TaxID=3092086 RepID=UPI001585C867|nr:hypothetical protein [Enterobacteriaceae bacterium BIT-l23]
MPQWLSLLFIILAFSFVLLFSLIYLLRPTFMPYHRQGVGIEWEQLDERVRNLILALMRAVGFAWLAWLLSCLTLLALLWREASGPVWWTFAALFAFGLLTQALVAASFRARTGARTPVGLILIMAALGAAGLVLFGG